jgi:hypothetical protein
MYYRRQKGDATRGKAQEARPGKDARADEEIRGEQAMRQTQASGECRQGGASRQADGSIQRSRKRRQQCAAKKREYQKMQKG